jgi:hypothetical protein
MAKPESSAVGRGPQGLPSVAYTLEEIAQGIGQMQCSLADAGVCLGDYFGATRDRRAEALATLRVAWGRFLIYAAGWLDSDIAGDESVRRRLTDRWDRARTHDRARDPAMDWENPPLYATVEALDADEESSGGA